MWLVASFILTLTTVSLVTDLCLFAVVITTSQQCLLSHARSFENSKGVSQLGPNDERLEVLVISHTQPPVDFVAASAGPENSNNPIPWPNSFAKTISPNNDREPVSLMAKTAIMSAVGTSRAYSSRIDPIMITGSSTGPPVATASMPDVLDVVRDQFLTTPTTFSHSRPIIHDDEAANSINACFAEGQSLHSIPERSRPPTYHTQISCASVSTLPLYQENKSVESGIEYTVYSHHARASV